MLSDLIIPSPTWLALATAGWYLASRAICGPLQARADRWMIAGLSLPFATTCLAAILLRHPEVAIGATLAGSVAAVTLVLGLVGVTQSVAAPTSVPKAWLFVLPTSIVALLIGFSGEIRLGHAAILLLQGVAVLLGSADRGVPRQAARISLGRWSVSAIALLAMLVASGLAVFAADTISHELQQPGSGLITAVMLSPALILPMIGVTTRLAGQRAADGSINLIVNVVLLNVCLLLPLSAIAWVTQSSAINTLSASFGTPTTMPASQPTTAASDAAAEIVHFAYPISVWRIDTTLLLVAGIYLLLLALGRVRLGPTEGTAMILIYVAYLMLTAVAAR